jgi:hypothetical protein
VFGVGNAVSDVSPDIRYHQPLSNSCCWLVGEATPLNVADGVVSKWLATIENVAGLSVMVPWARADVASTNTPRSPNSAFLIPTPPVSWPRP